MIFVENLYFKDPHVKHSLLVNFNLTRILTITNKTL